MLTWQCIRDGNNSVRKLKKANDKCWEYTVYFSAWGEKGTRPQKARCRCASEPKRVCFYFHEMKDGRNDGLMGAGHAGGRKERSSPIASECISSRNCSLPNGGHLTVLSTFIRGWLCLTVLSTVQVPQGERIKNASGEMQYTGWKGWGVFRLSRNRGAPVQWEWGTLLNTTAGNSNQSLSSIANLKLCKIQVERLSTAHTWSVYGGQLHTGNCAMCRLIYGRKCTSNSHMITQPKR